MSRLQAILPFLPLALFACGEAESVDRAPASTFARQAESGDALPPKLPAAQGEQLYWYDGGVKRPIWRDPDVVVEHDPTDASLEEIRSAVSGAEAVSQLPTARVWRVTADGESVKTLAAARPQANFSAGFRDNGARNGALRTPTGRIIVEFKGEPTSEELAAWSEAQGVTLDRKLPLGRPIYAFRAGDADPIALANRIHESGDVKWAQPDWWKGVVRK